MPRVPTEEEALRARDARNWRGRADALANVVAEFLRVDTACAANPKDREMHDRRVTTRLALRTVLAEYLRTD